MGPKTAASLLQDFGSVGKIFDRLDAVKSEKLRASLTASAGAVRRNQELVRLHEVPCALEPEKLSVRPADVSQLRGLFQRWGFRGMLAELDAQSAMRQTELI